MNLLLSPAERRLPANQLQGRLLTLAFFFQVTLATALTLSPAARLQSWQVALRWDHWLALPAWLAAFGMAHRVVCRRLPGRDPYLLPIAALLVGWGTLTIWRVAPAFGLRQSLWILVAVGAALGALRLPSDLRVLRNYKYLWLTGGLLLTALTLLLGTNPSGDGPRLWLGCCGVYFQPTEPLKLLLIVYLAAYLADRGHQIPRLLPLLAPTLVMIGLSLALLIVQRDLGTATIFLFLYTTMAYIATGRRRILLASLVALLLAGVTGYALFDVVRLRVEAWLNPWLDPSGRSYQIVQSLLAVAAGGLLGRGPGLGSPNLVPVQHSDFIFASIAEEGGLIGSLALVVLLAILTGRGLQVAMRAEDQYRRYLSVGVTAFLTSQSVLIIGGNMRLLPLTGVTLPFVSYGGSSLVTAVLALVVLLHVSHREPNRPAPLETSGPYLQVGTFLFAGLLAIAAVNGWWAIQRGPALLTRTDNPRRVISDRFVPRGALLDRAEVPLNVTEGTPGDLTRTYRYPALSTTLGYNHPIYGQAGLEESLDEYLRGLREQPDMTIWWNHLLYGLSPPGQDVRLSLDLALQRLGDDMLADRIGALVLLKSGSGEILILASHPYFDPNRLEETWSELTRDPRAPLLNRATQGRYPAGPALGALLLAGVLDQGALPDPPASWEVMQDRERLPCARSAAATVETWAEAVAAGCPGALLALGEQLGSQGLAVLAESAGIFESPVLRLDTGGPSLVDPVDEPGAALLGPASWRMSPIQMALAAAALSAGGQRPAPRLAMAVASPTDGWVVLPPLAASRQVLSPQTAGGAAERLAAQDLPIWETLAANRGGENQRVTWYVGGSTPDWEGTPLTLVLVLENGEPEAAHRIAREIWQAALAVNN